MIMEQRAVLTCLNLLPFVIVVVSDGHECSVASKQHAYPYYHTSHVAVVME